MESDKPDDDTQYVSDTEQNWDKLKKGTKLKRYILLTVALYIFFNTDFKKAHNNFCCGFGLKINFCLSSGYIIGEHVLIDYGNSKLPAKVSI